MALEKQEPENSRGAREAVVYLGYALTWPAKSCFLFSSWQASMNVRVWLKTDLQQPEIEVRLYEALAVKVVLVCVA
jgi:hypothetical protein